MSEKVKGVVDQAEIDAEVERELRENFGEYYRDYDFSSKPSYTEEEIQDFLEELGVNESKATAESKKETRKKRAQKILDEKSWIGKGSTVLSKPKGGSSMKGRSLIKGRSSSKKRKRTQKRRKHRK